MLVRIMRSKTPLLLVLVAVLLSGSGFLTKAQGVPGVEPTGIRDSSRLLEDVPRQFLGRATPLPKPTFLISTAGVRSEDVWLGQLSGVYINRAMENHPFQVKIGYSRLHPDAAESFNGYAAEGKIRFINYGDEHPFLISGILAFSNTVDVSHKRTAAVAVDYSFGKHAEYSLGATASYVGGRCEDCALVDDLIPAIGLSYAPSEETELSMDYTFDNDVDGESDYSFTLSQTLSIVNGARNPTFRLGVSKHRTVYGALVITLR